MDGEVEVIALSNFTGIEHHTMSVWSPSPNRLGMYAYIAGTYYENLIHRTKGRFSCSTYNPSCCKLLLF